MAKNLKEMKISELKEELRSRKLKTSGKKTDLIERLRAAMLVEDARREEEDDAPDDDIEDEDIQDDEEAEESEDDDDSNNSKNFSAAGKVRKKSTRMNEVSFKDVEGMIRCFTGEDNFSIDKWIEEFEGVATLLNLSELQQLVFAKKSLKGLAKIVAQTEVFTSWKKLKKGLREEFERKATSRELHQELASRVKKRNESTQEYLIMMREIASKGCIDDESLIQYVIDGINDSPANKAILYSAGTLAEFKTKLRLYDKIKGSTPKQMTTSEPLHSPPKGKEQKQDDYRQKNSKERRCYNCGEKSAHSSSNCPHKEKGTKCFRCNAFGHKSAECPDIAVRRVQFFGQQKNVMVANISGHDFDALIDTGSSPNLMKKQCHETIKSPPLSATTETFCGANGVLIHPIGQFRSTVGLDGEDFDTIIHVVPDSTMKHSVIIGDDLLRDAVLLVTPDKISVEKAKPHILSIHCSESTEPAIDVGETVSVEGKKNVEAMVAGYCPNKSKSTDVEMVITLKDKTPIWHHPRLLSPKEAEIVDQQVEEWIQAGIVEPCALELASPVVTHLSLTRWNNHGDGVTQDEVKGGILVQLRATLPRKQLDIPRFSPTTVWRLLTTADPPQQCKEDDVVHCKRRIFAPPLPIHIPALMDKSADSGISGDASPHHHDSTHNSQAAWTPQQDLEETSSDGGFPGAPVPQDRCPTAKFSPRFTLSLPRDDRVKLYSFDDKEEEVTQSSSLNSLKKLKRSMSGALGKVSPPREDALLEGSPPLLDSNWVLSRSVPNSLNMTHLSLTRWNDHGDGVTQDEEEDDMSSSVIKQPSFSYLASGGHVMYLPEYSKPNEKVNGNCALSLSKSCEDLSTRANIEEKSPHEGLPIVPKKKSKKFTFQSTVRQIERKRLAAQLSKQAETKEKERRSELEAMRKVEEEFQKKREREKADIRQQLRLYSLTQNSATKPPSPDALPSTHVLSEFRQQQREYKDYRPRRTNETECSPKFDQKSKKATVHPQVICQMPKSTQIFVTPKLASQQPSGGFDTNEQAPSSVSRDNYRKNFAQGGLPHSLASSDSELPQTSSGPTAKNRL